MVIRELQWNCIVRMLQHICQHRQLVLRLVFQWMLTCSPSLFCLVSGCHSSNIDPVGSMHVLPWWRLGLALNTLARGRSLLSFHLCYVFALERRWVTLGPATIGLTELLSYALAAWIVCSVTALFPTVFLYLGSRVPIPFGTPRLHNITNLISNNDIKIKKK